MSSIEIPAEVKDFVFQYIDSVEQLEILILLYSQAPKFWSSEEISDYLRSNKNSIEKRLSMLLSQRLIVESEDKTAYGFEVADDKMTKAMLAISESYKVHKYKILEMIFSPMKKSRVFADAFKLNSSKEDKGDKNG